MQHELFVGHPDVSDGTHLRIELVGDNNFYVGVGDGLLPYDGGWHNVILLWDVSVLSILFYLDGTSQSWNINATHHYNDDAFTIPYRGSRWTIGAELDTLGAPDDFYSGLLAELYAHFGNDDYQTLIIPRRGRNAFAMITHSGLFGPLELGVQCESVLGPNAGIPPICMRGDPLSFVKNQGPGTEFAVPAGFPPLFFAPNDPFDLWP